MGRGKRAALYPRVSTTGRTIENQRRELKQAARRHGWNVVAEFCDEGRGGKKRSGEAARLRPSMHGDHSARMRPRGGMVG